MQTTLLFLNKVFGKASLLAKFAILLTIVMGYAMLNLYVNIGDLNDKIIACHQARIADINSLFDRMNRTEVKVQQNAEKVKEVKEDVREVKQKQEVGQN